MNNSYNILTKSLEFHGGMHVLLSGWFPDNKYIKLVTPNSLAHFAWLPKFMLIKYFID